MPSDTIGIDLGGTKCWLARIDSLGQVLESNFFFSQPERGVQPILDDLVTHIQLLKTPHTEAIGIGIAAQVTPEEGVVSFAPNLKWKDVPLRSYLMQALNLPVAVLNDVRAAAFAEWYCGSGKNAQDLVALFLGTGVGGAVLSQGKWLTGANGCAGELGHLCVEMNGRLCGCGNHGCLEAYLGGIHITKRLRELIKQHPQEAKTLLSLAQDDIEAVNVPLLVQGCALNDPFSLKVEEGVFQALLAGGISIVHAFNPRVLILGGGLLEGFPYWVEKLEQALKQRVLPAAREGLSVRQALLKTQAGGIGAALYARL